MKRYIYKILNSLLLLGIVSCNDSQVVNEPEFGTNDIVIDFSSGAVASRAADEDYESRVTHLDVFIFEDAASDNDKVSFHYERKSVNAPQGKLVLEMSRDEFTVNAKYWVYVVANSSIDEVTMKNILNLGELKELIQRDKNVHLTSLTHLSTAEEPVPATFLMDGVCYVKPDTEGDFDMPSTIPAPSAININNSSTESTVLKVVLRRAASKIKVRINAGSHVKFDNSIAGSNAGYYLRNMPITTSVVNTGSTPTNVEVRKTYKLTNDYFVWAKDGSGKNYIEVTAYVYSHSWAYVDFFERGTSLIVDIPLYYNENAFAAGSEAITKSYVKSYYQIMLRPYEKEYFERNKYYTVEVTIDAPGAEEDSDAEILPELKYDVYDWTVKTVNINGTNGPKFLKVNQDTLKIYNVDKDLKSLYYTSSSKITSVVIRNSNSETPTPYYVNKFGVDTYVNPSTNGMNAKVAIANALNGNLEVYSNVPTNNAIRYFTIEITNAEGLTETVAVEQYPLVYITNTLGYYSYRDDYKSSTGDVTTYESGSSPYYTGSSYSNGSWSYSSGTGGTFFRSKYVGSTVTTGTNRGKSNLNYYYWSSNRGSYTKNSSSYKSASDGGNARMYHIRVSATSEDYVIGRPRLDANGFTDTGSDNAKLVSPSFALASQLGALQSPSLNLKNSAEHCNRYVETYKDANGKVVHLTDWRLPTVAELQFIINTQYVENSAMDEVLAGYKYMSADGTIFTNTNPNRTGGNGTYVRCVRDVF